MVTRAPVFARAQCARGVRLNHASRCVTIGTCRRRRISCARRAAAATTGNDLRIRDGVERGPEIRFRFDGREVPAYEGESVAAALWAAGSARGRPNRPADRRSRRALRDGVCQQCVLWIGEVRIEACRTPVRAGLDVRTRR